MLRAKKAPRPAARRQCLKCVSLVILLLLLLLALLLGHAQRHQHHLVRLVNLAVIQVLAVKVAHDRTRLVDVDVLDGARRVRTDLEKRDQLRLHELAVRRARAHLAEKAPACARALLRELKSLGRALGVRANRANIVRAVVILHELALALHVECGVDEREHLGAPRRVLQRAHQLGVEISAEIRDHVLAAGRVVRVAQHGGHRGKVTAECHFVMTKKTTQIELYDPPLTQTVLECDLKKDGGFG